ncbi:patatin-like phospholipase family protein [Oscillatoria sp. FACHB-1407]|uniref:patatin-like phospholipase family protein n=1 Tax=Oscillatoria sp. FACHB-1407 TaxID=2692847 RepID=UPI001686FD4E|nr:patatin-like phospholipase family protein [Oscillatoria sp. FACHB-1407]MBD2465967.1 patatin-like phospholipase family protein [Oscillatoria sp. FACHB-1407]
MTPNEPCIGLVLAGGGAKGAYHAGALRYIAELGFEPHIIAGTSIGALNGAILSANLPFNSAVQQMNELWDQLSYANILRPNKDLVIQAIAYGAKAYQSEFTVWLSKFLSEAGLLKKDLVIFDPEPIERFLKQAVSLESIKQGTELWIAAFPTLQIPGLDYSVLAALIDAFRAQTGTKAHWLRVQDCDDEEVLYNTLLASAAIPLIFPTRAVNGEVYVDGGLADNVPLGALAARGCTHAIVIHLSNGAIWDRHDFPNQTVVEIRPAEFINKIDAPIVGDVDALFDFSPNRVTDLKQRGYQDAKRCLEPIIQTFQVVRGQRDSHNKIVDLTKQLIDDIPLI